MQNMQYYMLNMHNMHLEVICKICKIICKIICRICKQYADIVHIAVFWHQYAKYAKLYAKYAKYANTISICRICTPHFADEKTRTTNLTCSSTLNWIKTRARAQPESQCTNDVVPTPPGPGSHLASTQCQWVTVVDTLY